jgi:hypothetical protein
MSTDADTETISAYPGGDFSDEYRKPTIQTKPTLDFTGVAKIPEETIQKLNEVLEQKCVTEEFANQTYAKNADLSNYATKTALKTKLGDYAKRDDLTNYAKKTDVDNGLGLKQDISEMNTYAKRDDLTDYATKTDLNDRLGLKQDISEMITYAKMSDISNLNDVTDDIRTANELLGTIQTDLSNLVTNPSDAEKVTELEQKLQETQNKLDEAEKKIAAAEAERQRQAAADRAAADEAERQRQAAEREAREKADRDREDARAKRTEFQQVVFPEDISVDNFFNGIDKEKTYEVRYDTQKNEFFSSDANLNRSLKMFKRPINTWLGSRGRNETMELKFFNNSLVIKGVDGPLRQKMFQKMFKLAMTTEETKTKETAFFEFMESLADETNAAFLRLETVKDVLTNYRTNSVENYEALMDAGLVGTNGEAMGGFFVVENPTSSYVKDAAKTTLRLLVTMLSCTVGKNIVESRDTEDRNERVATVVADLVTRVKAVKEMTNDIENDIKSALDSVEKMVKKDNFNDSKLFDHVNKGGSSLDELLDQKITNDNSMVYLRAFNAITSYLMTARDDGNTGGMFATAADIVWQFQKLRALVQKSVLGSDDATKHLDDNVLPIASGAPRRTNGCGVSRQFMLKMFKRLSL